MEWTKKRVLVTGGKGFLGSFVVDKLRERGAAELVAPSSAEFDLVRPECTRALLKEFRPHLVLHLAARVGGIGANRDNPASFFYDNLLMGVQLIHESWKVGVEKLVAAGTVCAYPKYCPTPFREADLWNGFPEETNAPYGIAKKVLGVQSAAYRQQYGFNSCVVYPVNLYGPRDNFDLHTSHVIPAMIRKFRDAVEQEAPAVTLWGDGSPTREFFFVEDAAEALVRCLEDYESSEPLNLGSGEEVSIRALADKVAGLVGFTGAIHWDLEKPNGQPRRRLDVTKAEKQLGFRAEVPLDEGLRRTWEWFRANEY